MNAAKAGKRIRGYVIVAIGLAIAAPVCFFGVAFAIVSCEGHDSAVKSILEWLALGGSPSLLLLSVVVLVIGALRDELTSGPDDLLSRPLGKRWEVERADGSIGRFTVVGALLREILSGRIRPDDKARKAVSAEEQSNGHETEKWGSVRRQLVSSSFHLRAAITPIWAHSTRGAQIGSHIGIVLCLVAGIYRCLMFEWFGVAYWLCLFAIPWIRGFTWGKARQSVDAPSMAIVGISLFLAMKLNDFVPIWESLPMALGWQFGATLAGAIAGVFPGVALGTLVGIWREPHVAKSPCAVAENKSVMFLKWIVLPGVFFCALVTSMVFLSDAAISLLEQWIETVAHNGT